MFKAQIRQLSAMPKADDFEEWKAEMAMKTTKQLLLFCGSILSSEQRNVIEYCIAVALSCLAKGVCSSSCAVVDRKVRRVGCMDKSGISIGSANGRLIEPIRYSIEAQLALLDLATTDVLSPRSVGTLSGNISLLKLVAEVISNHPSAQCRAEARVTLSVIDSILHPSAVPLPAIAMSTLIRSHLAEKDMTNDEAMNTSMGIIGFNQFSTAPAELANQDLFRADTSGFDASHDLPRTEEPAVAAVSVQSLENFSAMNAPFKVKSALITGSSATVTGVKRALPLESADSDDDIDLPDIV